MEGRGLREAVALTLANQRCGSGNRRNFLGFFIFTAAAIDTCSTLF